MSIVDGFRSNLGEPRFYNCDVAIPRSAANVMWYNHRALHGELVPEGVHQDHGADEEADGLVVPGAREHALHRRPHIGQFHARAAELVVAGVHGLLMCVFWSTAVGAAMQAARWYGGF